MRDMGVLLATLILVSCAHAPRASQTEVPRPNVVIFFTDDQGYGDLSCFGHPTIHTPHVDRLAREGAKLTQFYVPSPVCSPSRAALLTGCYPKRIGMHEHVVFPEDNDGLHPDEVTLAELLREEGYATGIFGKWHLGHRQGLLPPDQGFDEFFGVPYSNDMSQFHRKPGAKYALHLPLMRGAEVIEWEPEQPTLSRDCTDAALEFLERVHEQPFFLYVPFSMPHIPIYASEEFRGRSPRGLYGDVIEEIDHSVGRVLDRLDALDVAENTIVVFTSDNGPWLPFKKNGGTAASLRDGKGTNWEGGQRVPCVVRWPAEIPASTVRRELLTSMDLAPTIAKLAGAVLPEDREIDGLDIRAVLRGDAGAAAPLAGRPFVYYTAHGRLAGIRRGPWKLMLYDSQSKEEVTRLYDVEIDISEEWDRAEQHPDRVADLRELALRLDGEITANARPKGQSEPLVFDPRHPVNPDGTPFVMPEGRRRVQ